MEIDKQKLITMARNAMKKAIAPCSKFKVGAALLTDSGNIYTGCNIENPSLTLSICAERVALFKALSEGERTFKTIAIVSSSSNYCPPCGACRQTLHEFAQDIEIILANEAGSIITRRITELLPQPFTKSE